MADIFSVKDLANVIPQAPGYNTQYCLKYTGRVIDK